MKKKLDKNKGILFWITGLRGPDKLKIVKQIKKKIINNHGPTILINEDDMRNIFELRKYSQKERINNQIKFSDFCMFLTNQKINVIFSVVDLFDKITNKNKINIKPEFFKKPNILVINFFKKNVKELVEDIFNKIPKKYI